MAQNYASERSQTGATKAASPAAKSTEPTAPERSLADLQTQADQGTAIQGTAQLKAMESIQRVEEEEALQGKFAEPVQRMEEEEALQGKFAEPVQRMEEEEALQGKFADPVQRMEQGVVQGNEINSNGMPQQLQSGMEALSGQDMSGVNVHYNSAAPAAVGAHAYAQGSDIHLASGQEQHLPHEAWHTVQQAQGRVEPNTQVNGTSVNDDASLEREADVMGAKAAQMKPNITKA